MGTALAAWRNPSECHLNRIAATIRIWILRYTTFLRSKIFRQVTQLQIRIPGPSLSGGQPAVRWWDSQVEFRIALEHLWKKIFNPRCTFIHTYNVHCNTYILAPVFIYFLLDSGGGKGWYKAHAAQLTTGGFWILKLLLCTGGVTAKERTGLRRFFFLIKPDSTDKTNKK